MAKKKKKKKPKARMDEEFGAMVKDAESVPAEGRFQLLTLGASSTSLLCHAQGLMLFCFSVNPPSIMTNECS